MGQVSTWAVWEQDEFRIPNGRLRVGVLFRRQLVLEQVDGQSLGIPPRYWKETELIGTIDFSSDSPDLDLNRRG